jgi:hypothetical protein
LERFIFRRGMWHEPDLRAPGAARGVDGLQFWNGHRGQDYADGRSFWIARLLAGERISPIGANDAHGDLNRCIGVKTPLFSLYQNRNHVYGHVRTVVKAKSHDMAGIQAGLGSGRLICTDGPFLDLEREGAGARLVGRSIADYGGFTRITLWSGTIGASRETAIRTWTFEGTGPLEVSESIAPPAGIAYLRAEGATGEKRFALTAPLYL